MTTALQSNELQEIFKAEDGAGNLKKIEYFEPSRMSPQSARLEIAFINRSGPSLQECTLIVYVNVNTNKIEGLNKMPCKELK